MKKCLKVFVSILVIISIFLLSENVVNAETFIGSSLYREKVGGALWWTQYQDYGLRAYQTGTTKYAYPNMSGGVVLHTQNGGPTELTITNTETYGIDTTFSMNDVLETGIEAEGIKLAESKGYGVSVGFSYSFSRASGIKRTIPSDKATGEYEFAVYTNVYECRGEKWDVSFVEKLDTWNYCMPYGQPGYTVLVSTDNQNTWSWYYS